MKFTLKEMQGLLNGKCLPSDLIVGETLAEYMVRKFDELEQKLTESQREFRAADATIENLQMQVEKLAAENAYLVPKAASELSNAWVLHKYLIGIQAAIMYLDNGNKKAAQEWLYGTIAGPGFEFPDEVEDIDAWATHQMRGSISHPQALEIIKAETPATDAFLAEVRAQGVKLLSNAVQSVISERQRQQSVEGWTPEHDDQYSKSQLLWASSCYVLNTIQPFNRMPMDWPWAPEWWKPTNPRRDLVKAGALILAEIERIDRQEAAQ